MEKQEVIDLMRSSKSVQEWNANCDKVKRAERAKGEGKEYPDWWYPTIIVGGIQAEAKRAHGWN